MNVMTNAIDNHQNHAQAEKTVAMLARMEPKGIEFVDYEMFYELISLPGSTGFVNGMVASHLLCHSGTINRHSLNGALLS
ncbi:hypothetical protein AM387_14815 [Klebsiella pneumoniae]|nr:hypothetical protein A8C02_23200 [Klebsiella pneumoniae]AWC99862.1 hypothetical protein AM388_20830 [Klebsiella pneumoniae]AWD97579.1 hypothetical protein AM389_21120 [Klebsiella pneumoniae]AWS84756.1 hypothetical protein AM387_14815 [Klebsiella pneumoniae]